jgi:hypothetical protein
MAHSDADKAGANAGADDKSKQAVDNTDDATSGKNAADKNKSDEGNKNGDGDSKSKQIVFESQEAVDRMIQKRIDRIQKDDAEKAKLSKEQLLEKERDDALQSVRVSNARDAFIEKAGIKDYAKATKIFRMYQSELEFGTDGKPSNLPDVIKSAKSDWPELFGKVAPGGGDLGEGKGDGQKSAGSDMNSLLRHATGRKS